MSLNIDHNEILSKTNIDTLIILMSCTNADKNQHCRYKDFSSRMEQYRQQLEETLGIQEEESEKKELLIDRNSDPSLEAKVKEAAAKELKELNEEKRRSARRKEYVLV